MQIFLKIHEVVGRGSRAYMEINGTVNVADIPYRMQHGYNIYRVHMDPKDLASITPIPAKVDVELYLNGELTGDIKKYRTPTHPNPHHDKQQSIPGGKAMKFTTADPIPLPGTLPMVLLIQAAGYEGDKLVVKLKLQRVHSATNIHSESVGNLYFYAVDKVYVYLQHPINTS